MKAWNTLGAALLLSACAPPHGSAPPAEKPEQTANATTGAELRRLATVRRAQPERGPNTIAVTDAGERRATTLDLEVQLHGPGRIGPLHEGHLDAAGLTVEVQNRSDRPVEVDSATALVEVYPRGHLLPGCAARVSLKLPRTLGPHVVHRAQLPVPCPLQPGEYDVVATVVVGDEDPEVVSPAEARRADQVSLHVDASLPAAGSGAMPIAPVHAPPVSGTEVPASADRLPEETGPGGPSRPSVP